MRKFWMLLIALGLGQIGTAAAAGLAGVTVEGTSLKLLRTEGGAIEGEALVGARMAMRDELGRSLMVRIDAITPDPEDRTGAVMLYALSAPDAAGSWQPACPANAYGNTEAVLQTAGEGTVAIWCVAGALAKCVRFGYHPWRTLPDGTPLAPYHRACVNLVRADYCGDDRPTTLNGMWIDLYDRLGIQVTDGDPSLGFEAAWGEEGALCVARPRVPQNISLDSCSNARGLRIGSVRYAPRKLPSASARRC
jgi:hypothetical protein